MKTREVSLCYLYVTYVTYVTEENRITKDIPTLREQLQVVHDKYKLSSFWSKSNQVRIGRYDTKFYEYKNEAYSSIDIVDVNVNPIGHFFCDFMGLCR